MLKKHVLKRLLPLLFSFCCVFSGFLSVDAFAAYSTYPQYDLTLPSLPVYQVVNGTTYPVIMVNGDDANYHMTQGQGWINDSDLFFLTYLANSNETDDKFYFPINTQLFDYYLVANLSVDQVGTDFTIGDFDLGNLSTYSPMEFASSNILTDKRIYYSKYDIAYQPTYGIQSITCTAKLNLDFVGDLNLGVFHVSDVNGGLYDNTKFFNLCVIVSNKGSEDAYNEIIAAIIDQTSSLGGKLDSIDQSIEDQYSGDPESEFSVDDVITQHNEKMGVLSFGSDVMLQFLDMFQSANVGTAELTLPGFNITVENVEYSVWPDYSFNFEQLNEWVPALMSVIRLMLPAFVWLMVLRYCIKVFEDNFLAK